MCFRTLAQRDELTAEDLETLKSSNEYRFRVIYLEYRIKNKKEYVEPATIKELLESVENKYSTPLSLLSSVSAFDTNPYRHIIELSFHNLEFDSLILEIDWFNTYSSEAYSALIQKHWNKYKTQFKNDVESDFETIHHASLEKLKSKFGDLIATHLQEWDKPERQIYLRADFQKAALTIALKRKEIWAVKILVQNCMKNFYWSTEDIVIDAIKKHSRVFPREFLESTLVKFKNYKKDTIREIILKRYATFENDYKKMFDSGDPAEFQFAAKLSRQKYLDKASKYVRGFVWDKEERIRLSALSLISYKSKKADLIRLLEEYYNHDSYYYDVVCWIDRLIYAPRKIRNRYRTLIDQWTI